MEPHMGRAWKLGDGITTDDIIPGRFFHLRSNLPELARHALEDAMPGFAANVKEGDFIVAGRNFGQGSSREHAPIVLKLAGAQAVLAEGFARIFFRNAINTGLPAVVCDTGQIDDGDELEILLDEGRVIDRTKGIELTFPPLPPIMQTILADGGLVAHVKKHGRFAVPTS
jgi:3-isopropylmalate/(R)-2-methylmalate dehydratase small subunit